MTQWGRRRALGQHFLRDQGVARAIAEAAVREAVNKRCLSLLEIGPGRGALTTPILNLLKNDPGKIQEILLVERDRDLSTFWQKRLDSEPRLAGTLKLNVQTYDFLNLPEDHWLKIPPLAVASNLPYSAATAIMIRLARHPKNIAVMVLMFQAEVAKRLRAEIGTKDWGSLSIWIQNRWDVKKLLSVPPRAFNPPPKVDSEVVLITPRQDSRVPVEETAQAETCWETLLKVCFAHRRKMLRSSLPSSGPWKKALELAEIDSTKRSEILNWDEWRRLYQATLRC